MPLDIRETSIVIRPVPGDVKTGISIGSGEKLLAAWWTPTDNLGVGFTGHKTIIPGISPENDLVLGIQPHPNLQGGATLRVTVDAIVEVPLIKVGAGKIFSDRSLTLPERQLRMDPGENAFIGVPVTNTSDLFTIKSISLGLVFESAAFSRRGVTLDVFNATGDFVKAPDNNLLASNIRPKETRAFPIRISTRSSAENPITEPTSFEIRLQLVSMEITVADSALQRNFTAQTQKFGVGNF